MAERGGHAPQSAMRIDFLSTESRFACPVHVPFRARGRNCACTGPILNRMSLLLDYTGLDDCAPGRIEAPASMRDALCDHYRLRFRASVRTDTESGLSRLPLLIGLQERNGPGGRSCTRTGSVLSGVPLLVGLRRGNEWCSRQEFRLQPPRSKRGALYIELRER